MSGWTNPDDLYTAWLNSKSDVTQALCELVRENKSGDAGRAIDLIGQRLDFLEKATRAVFDSDESRIHVRNQTITDLQDKIASKNRTINKLRNE